MIGRKTRQESDGGHHGFGRWRCPGRVVSCVSSRNEEDGVVKLAVFVLGIVLVGCAGPLPAPAPLGRLQVRDAVTVFADVKVDKAVIRTALRRRALGIRRIGPDRDEYQFEAGGHEISVSVEEMGKGISRVVFRGERLRNHHERRDSLNRWSRRFLSEIHP